MTMPNTLPFAEIAAMLQPRPLYAAYSVICREREQAIFERAEKSFSMLMSQRFCGSTGPTSFIPFKASSLSQAMTQATTEERLAERWRVYEEEGVQVFNPTDADGEAAPQCVLLLAAQHLLDREPREQLLEQLKQHAQAYSRFLLLFVADKGQVGFTTGDDMFAACIAEFSALAPKPVAIHLVSPQFEDGGPVTDEDLGDGIAVALMADIVLPNRRAPRILSDLDDEADVQLSAFGVKAVMYNGDRLATQYACRLTAELAGQTLLKAPSSDHTTAVGLTSPRDVLASLDLSVPDVTVEVRVAGPLSGHGATLQGRDYSVSVDCDGAALADIFEDQAPDEWGSALQRQRQFVQQVALPTAELKGRKACEVLTSAEGSDLANQVGRVLGRDGVSAALAVCDQLSSRISALYWTAPPLESDWTQQVDSAMSDLDQAVKRIPSSGQVLGKSLLRWIPLGFLGWLSWHFGLVSGMTAFALCGVAALFIALHSWWKQHHIYHVARRQARHVSNRIRSESHAAWSRLLRQLLEMVEHALQIQLATCKERIGHVQTEMTRIATRLEDEGYLRDKARAVKHLPLDRQQEKYLEDRIRSGLALDELRVEVTKMVRQTATRILCDGEPPSILPATLSQTVRDFCRAKLQQICLADFFMVPSTDHFGNSCHHRLTAEWRRLRDRPSVFLQNRMLSECLAQPHLLRRCVLVPTALRSVCQTTEPLAADLNDNLLAMIVRVRLAQCADSHGSAGLLCREPSVDWINREENRDPVVAESMPGRANIQPDLTQ